MHSIQKISDAENTWHVVFRHADGMTTTLFTDLNIRQAGATASYLNGGAFDADVGEVLQPGT